METVSFVEIFIFLLQFELYLFGVPYCVYYQLHKYNYINFVYKIF